MVTKDKATNLEIYGIRDFIILEPYETLPQYATVL